MSKNKTASENSLNLKECEHNEQQRRLQVTGGSTFIVSLPKEWVTRNQLKQGSSMVLREEDDGSLSISSSNFPSKEKKIEAFVQAFPTDNPDAVMRKAISLYLNGYSILHIYAKDKETLSSKLRERLKSFARNYLVGTEIVIDTPNELTLQVLLNYPELTVQHALSRMAIISSSMHKEAIDSLGNLEHTNAKTVIATDKEVNRFGLYIVRLLKMAVSNLRIVKEIGLSSQKECIGYRLIAKAVERTADHATKIAENTLLLKEQVDEPLMEKIALMSEFVNSMFNDAIEALFKHNYDLAENVIERLGKARELEHEVVIASQTVTSKDIVNLRLIIESIRRIAEYASDISEVVLNLNVEFVVNKKEID